MLQALVPYSRANLKFSFARKSFYNDLAKISRSNAGVTKTTYYRALRNELIYVDEDGIPRLSKKGKKRLDLFQAQNLKGEGQLMIIFDIPEKLKAKRQQLRALLRELYFVQSQKSVWITDRDCKKYLTAGIQELGLSKYIKLYECHELDLE